MIASPLTLTERTLILLPDSRALPAYLLPRGVERALHSAGLAGKKSVQTDLEGGNWARAPRQQGRGGRKQEAAQWGNRDR